MKLITTSPRSLLPLLAGACLLAAPVCAQQNPPGGPPDRERPGPPFGPGGGGPPGGMMREKTLLVKQFDKDRNGRLNLEERAAARQFLQKEKAEGRGRRGFGPPGGRRFGQDESPEEPNQPGAKISVQDVKTFPNVPLYDAKTIRTYFLEFESPDWEKELSDFHDTDVEVPAKLTVDGKVYQDVGVHFRGMSSYGMVREGQKRSLNVTVDFAHGDQNLYGYRTLNLLNSHEDPTFLRSVLFYHVAREYVPAPKANFARVVINGESWGIYSNVEQFNKDFVKEWFGTTKGARWKVPGSPRGRGSLAYLGEDVAEYKRIYQIKSKDDPKSWAALIRLCKVLNETPPDKLVAALAPLLDIEGALKFLALDNALINNDGYWIRTSDYSIYLDEKGRFHVLPQDANETFARPGGPGFGGPRGRGPGGGGPPDGPGGRGPGPGPGGNMPRVDGVKLDPLLAANDDSKPLISKLLAVPALRAQYLGYVREIAEKWLDWSKLGPIAESYHALIAADVRADTRKLDPTEAFEKSLTQDIAGHGFGPGGGGSMGLKNFADQRRAFLLNYPGIATLPAKN